MSKQSAWHKVRKRIERKHDFVSVYDKEYVKKYKKWNQKKEVECFLGKRNDI